MAKEPRKLRVEFELDADAVMELIKTAGTPASKRLSRADLEKLSKEGALRASEFLKEPAVSADALIIGKLVGKAVGKGVNKATSKLSSKTVQAVAATEVVDKGIDIVASPTIIGRKTGRKA
jgi:hypothetical protein